MEGSLRQQVVTQELSHSRHMVTGELVALKKHAFSIHNSSRYAQCVITKRSWDNNIEAYLQTGLGPYPHPLSVWRVSNSPLCLELQQG
ncbi:uncharacterized [Tachysurus ichikawai]